MTIHPITADTPKCFGVCCNRHQDCVRYLSVDNMPAGSVVIGTCEDHGEHPLFVEVAETTS